MKTVTGNKYWGKIIAIILLLAVCCPAAFAQADSAGVLPVSAPPPPHSPRKASILSAVLPGAGQVYNKQYWKVPVVYAAIAIPAYYVAFNTKNFKEFKQGYIYASDSTGTQFPQFAGRSKAYLSQGIEFYRRNRDYSYFFLGLAYILNIVDAAVYAHLFYFDVSEDISLNIQPYNNFSAQPAYGLRLVMNF
jgi:hypothetical protein